MGPRTPEVCEAYGRWGRGGWPQGTMRPLPPLHPAGRISAQKWLWALSAKKEETFCPQGCQEVPGGAGRNGEQLLHMGECAETNTFEALETRMGADFNSTELSCS